MKVMNAVVFKIALHHKHPVYHLARVGRLGAGWKRRTLCQEVYLSLDVETNRVEEIGVTMRPEHAASFARLCGHCARRTKENQ